MVEQSSASPKRAYAIIRVSDRPADKMVYSPQMQRGEITAMAEQENLEIVEWGEDLLVSGRKKIDRYTKVRAIELAEAGLIDVIAVADWTRWSREDPGQVLSLLTRLQDLKVAVWPARQRDLRASSDDMYWVRVAFYAQMANQEAKVSAEKASEGIKYARSEHGTHWGKTPIGWKRSGRMLKQGGQRGEGKLEPDWEARGTDELGRMPRNAHTLKWLYEKRAEGWGWKRLATASGLSAWGIQYALTSKIKGKVRRERAERGFSQEPASLRNRGTIVGEELYDFVQAIGAGASSLQPRQNRVYLWTGLVRCPHCGQRMICKTQHAGDDHHRALPLVTCKSPHAWQPHPWRSVRQIVLMNALQEQFPIGTRFPARVAEQIVRKLTETNSAGRKDASIVREQRRKQLLLERGQVERQHKMGAWGVGAAADRRLMSELKEIDEVLRQVGEPIAKVEARQAVAAIQHFAELIPQDFDDPEEVLRCRRVLERMVERIDLSPRAKKPTFVLREPFRTVLAEAKASSKVQQGLAVLEGGAKAG